MVMPPAAGGDRWIQPLIGEIFRRQRAASEGDEAELACRFAGLRE